MPAKPFLPCNITHSEVPVIRVRMPLGDPLFPGTPVILKEEEVSEVGGRSESELQFGISHSSQPSVLGQRMKKKKKQLGVRAQLLVEIKTNKLFLQKCS